MTETEILDTGIKQKLLHENRIICFYGGKKPVYAGENLGLKMNVSVGVNDTEKINIEEHKIHAIAKHWVLPDLMMDLSTIKTTNPLYRLIAEEIGCPVGTVPTYICFKSNSGISKTELLETIAEQVENGVSFMTLHLTADLKLAEKALSRRIPIISRGGSLLLRDMKMNRREDNILLQNLDEIIKLCKKSKVVISIGTTFRPSTIHDALDEINIREVEHQKKLCAYLIDNGIQVQMEGMGHIPFHRISEYISIIRNGRYIPFMPLGPIISDRTAGFDHINAAIGSSYMALKNGADIINAITREEHTGGIPDTTSIIEAINTAAVVVRVVNDARFFDPNEKESVRYHNCMNVPDQIGCSRCGLECPFLWNDDQLEEQDR